MVTENLTSLTDDHLLPLLGSAVALLFFVEEFPVVLNAANGGNSRGRNFHQVETALAGDLERFKRGEDAELLTVFVDHANFTGADSIIDTDELLRGTLIDGFFSCARSQTARQLSISTACQYDAAADFCGAISLRPANHCINVWLPARASKSCIRLASKLTIFHCPSRRL